MDSCCGQICHPYLDATLQAAHNGDSPQPCSQTKSDAPDPGEDIAEIPNTTTIVP